jgi:hypothetical protein
MKKPLLAASLVLAILATTSACGSSTMTTPPDINLNPRPTKRYELTVTIKNAPGPFDSMQTIAQYDVTDRFCVPTLPGSGATNPPDKTVPLTMTKVDENTYTGTFYADLIKDEAYSEKGMCHWKLTAVSMYLQHKNLTLPPSISLDNILAKKSETTYFSGLSYAQADNERIDNGMPDDSRFLPSDHSFSVTFEAKEHFQ